MTSKSVVVMGVAALALGGGGWLAWKRTSTPPPVPAAPASQPGLSQPGFAQSGLVQPGMPQAIPTQPGLPQPNLIQSGLSQPGLPQPAPPSYPVVKHNVEATVRSQPKSYQIRMQAAQFYVRAGDYAAAIPHLQVAARLQPKQILPWIALGDADTFTGKFRDAEAAYTRAAAQDPANALMLRGRAQLLIAQKRFPEARTLLEAAVKKHPDDPELLLALGNLYLGIEKPRLAVDTLQKAAGLAPNSTEIHFLLADAHAKNLHVQSAIDELQTVVRLDPQNDQAWGRMGLYQVNLTKYEEARTSLNNAIRINPKESYYYGTLADSYILDGTNPARYDQAVELYEKALQVDPHNAKALYSYAMGLTRRGKPEDLRKAIGLFNRMLGTNTKDMNVHFKLAETYRRLGDERQAQAHMAQFRRYFEAGRQQTKERYHAASFVDTAAAHMKLAQEYVSRQKYDLAETEFHLALERDPKLEEARRGLEALPKHGSTPAAGKTP